MSVIISFSDLEVIFVTLLSHLKTKIIDYHKDLYIHTHDMFVWSLGFKPNVS
jgi:hypothetical protein